MDGKLLSKLINLDYFGRPIQLRIDGKTKFKTYLGSLITLIIIALMISLIVQQGEYMLYHKNPNINQMILYSEMAPNLEINNQSLMWAFQIIDSNFKPFYDETYFSFSMTRFILNRDETGIPNVTNSIIPLVNCSEKKENFANFISNYNSNGLDFAKCMLNQEVKIGGQFTREFFSYLNLRVNLCKNTTHSLICKSKQEIIDKLNQGFFQFYYIDKYIDTGNFSIPYQKFFGNYFNILDPQMYKYLNFYFQKSLINTDEGFLFESLNKQEVILFDKFHESSTLTIKGEAIIDFFILPSNNQQNIFRNYMKIQDLAATLGGILKICLVLGFILTDIVNHSKLTEKLINNLFIFDYENSFKKNEIIDKKNLIELGSSNLIILGIHKDEGKLNKDSILKLSKSEDLDSNLIGQNPKLDVKTLKGNAYYTKIKEEVEQYLINQHNQSQSFFEQNYFEIFSKYFSKSRNKKQKLFDIGENKVNEYFDFLKMIQIHEEVFKIKKFIFDQGVLGLLSITEKKLLSDIQLKNEIPIGDLFDNYIELISNNDKNSEKIIELISIKTRKYFDKMIEKLKANIR